MRLLKPEWMHHGGDQILSLDIDPTGVRIATAGRGEASGKICIWDLECVKKIILDGGNFEKYAAHAKVSELEEHTGCVNCVRWSKNGQLLASGGDDCNVIIWCRKKMKTYTNEKALKNREMWKSLHTLQGHTGDILDIAWSNCKKFLASASIDNLIFIWDANNFPNILRKLVGHQSFVKGLAWDPVGEFLASQSDDKTLMIWSTLNFVGDNDSTVSPTAVVKKPFKKATSLTQFLRLGWSTDGQYIVSAHAANNTAPVAKIIERSSWISNKDCVGHRAAISSVAFNPNIYKEDETANDEDINVVCALGSRDGTLSLWKFPEKRPFIVVHNLFISAIADMCWNSAGNILLVSCVEGNLSFVTFDPMKDFGRYPLNASEITSYHNKHYGLNIKTAYQIPTIPMSADFLETNHTNGVHVPSPSPTESSNSGETILTRACNHQNTQSQVEYTPNATDTNPIEEATSNVVPKQKETILKDGRKRITPILIAAPIEDSPSKTRHSESNAIHQPKKSKRKNVHFENSESIPDRSNISSNVSIVPKKISSFDGQPESANVIGIFSRRLPITSSKVKTPSISSFHEFTIDIDQEIFHVSIKNESKDPKWKAYELRCLKNNQLCWSCCLLGRVVFIKCCEKMIVCTTEDNRLHVFNYSGWRIFPQIIISDTVIGLFLSLELYISVVTTFGQILVWDVFNQKILHNNIYIPMDRIKDNSYGSIKSVDVHPETEQPIVTLNDYTTYLYNCQLAAWLPLTDKMCNFASCFPSLVDGLISIMDDIPLSNIPKFHEANNLMDNLCPESSSIVGCTSFLLNQLDVFATLKMKQPFYDTFIILIQFLTEQNQEQTILSLCEHLACSHVNKNDAIFRNVGFSGMFLLEKLLSIIKRNIKMQQAYFKFQSLLP